MARDFESEFNELVHKSNKSLFSLSGVRGGWVFEYHKLMLERGKLLKEWKAYEMGYIEDKKGAPVVG